MSYLAFIVPNILSRRSRVIKGPFTMPAPVFYTVASITSMYMTVWIVIYCFPFAVPFNATTMNYTSVMTGGCTILLGWVVLVDQEQGIRLSKGIVRRDGEEVD